MPPLKNPREERLAQFVARTKTEHMYGPLSTGKKKRTNLWGNAAAACGYSNCSNALNAAKRPRVAARIAEIMGAAARRAEIDIERVLRELAAVGFADVRRLFDEHGNLKPPAQLSDEAAAAIASIEVVTRGAGQGEVEYVHKVRCWDKVQALVKLGQHLGGFKERVEHTGADGQPIPIQVITGFDGNGSDGNDD